MRKETVEYVLIITLVALCIVGYTLNTVKLSLDLCADAEMETILKHGEEQ